MAPRTERVDGEELLLCCAGLSALDVSKLQGSVSMQPFMTFFT